MTREEEIYNAMGDAEWKHIDGTKDIELFDMGFKEGAQWADQHPHWISVEDELPKIETEVLMVSSGCTGTLCGYRCTDGKKGWYCCNDDNYWHNITHWMPMPAPPEKGGEQ